MVEFPLLNIATAGLLLTFPWLPFELTSRVVSVLLSLGALTFFFAFTKQYFGKKIAHLSALLYAVMPYSMFYSRAVLPEPALLFFALGSLWSFGYWLQTKQLRWYLFSSIFLLIAFLLKPFIACYMFLYAVLVLHTWGKDSWKQPLLYLFPLPALAAFGWWRHWIEQFPSGIPANDWLFNGNGIRFRPAWFRWLGYERLTKLLLGFTGVVFFIAGLIPKRWNLRAIPLTSWIIWGWWLGLGLYSIVIATGSVQHDYYQVIWIPAVALTVGQGIVTLDRGLSKRLSPQYSSIAIVCLLISMWILSWQYISGFYQVNHWEYVRAGEAVDRLVPQDALVIAPAFGDTSFLFQTKRRGWPIGFEIADKIEKGATHYVTTSLDAEAKELMEQYTILEQTAEYVIIDLTRQKQP